MVVFAAIRLQVTKFKKYKIWVPKSPSLYAYVVMVLSCPLIGSLRSSTANQRAAQNNCYKEPDFGDPSICTFLPALFFAEPNTQLVAACPIFQI